MILSCLNTLNCTKIFKSLGFSVHTINKARVIGSLLCKPICFGQRHGSCPVKYMLLIKRRTKCNHPESITNTGRVGQSPW